ncbi:MAG TPA: ABC transporter substrate-binding protein [Gemmatimonadales bacterium]
MRPLRTLAPIATSVFVLLAACGAVAERRGGTVLFASGADLQSINPLLTVHPLARQVQRYVLFTTLAQYDSALVPTPWLARAWTWSADSTTLTFRLRRDISWHDGVRTTARDAAWTLTAALDPATGYPRLSELAGLRSIAAPDDTTLVLRFDAPVAAFPDVLTDLAILPAHLLDTVPHVGLRRAAFNERPVGNGPFRFVAHEPNRRWVFARNPEFPAELGRPDVERFIVVVVDEPTTKLAALTSGELDFAGIQPAHAEFVERDPRLAVLSYPLLFTYGIVLNTRAPPFADPAVRRALSAALDRTEIVEGYLYGFGTPALGPVPAEAPGAIATGSVAAGHGTPAAGAPDGRRVRFELLTVGSGEAALEQMVQAQLARAGFEVTIRQLELSAFLDRVYGPRHSFEAAVLGIPGDLALGYLAPLAELAGMPEAADPAAVQRLFADSVPIAFLYHARGLQGMNRRVGNVRMDLRGELAGLLDWRIE